MPEITSPRVRLPWDVLVLVCKEADRSTLVALGRVSYDLLTVTTPLLYHDVELKSLQQLETLFCKPVETLSRKRQEQTVRSISRIEWVLSRVPSQIKNLTVDLASMDRNDAAAMGSLSLDLSRPSAFPPIPLSNLRIICHHQAVDLFKEIVQGLISKVNPKHWSHEIEVRKHADDIGISAWPIPKAWNRLEEMKLSGAFPNSSHWRWVSPALGEPVHRHPSRRRVIRLHVGSLLDSIFRTPTDLLVAVQVFMGEQCRGGMQDGTVVLIVPSEAERHKLEDLRSDSVFARWRRVLAVELQV